MKDHWKHLTFGGCQASATSIGKQRCDNPIACGAASLITAALAAVGDDLPSNMVTLRNVCVQETTITLHASTADAKGQLCGLTAYHARREARERCRENDDDAFVAGVLAEALPRFRVRRSMEAYPSRRRDDTASGALHADGQHRPRPLQRVAGRLRVIARAALRRAVRERHVVHGPAGRRTPPSPGRTRPGRWPVVGGGI